MKDSPQTKVEKLIKYGNDKFGLSETTLRGVLDNASAGSSDEWQPNPTWWDIKTILENDTRDYPQKMIWLLTDDEDESLIKFIGAVACETSDGVFYDANLNTGITHTWDKTKDKACIVDGVEVYKTRYIILYFRASTLNRLQETNPTIYGLYVVCKDISLYSYAFYGQYALEAIDGTIYLDTYPASTFEGCVSLKKYPQINIESIPAGGSNLFAKNRKLQKPLALDYSLLRNSTSDMYKECDLREYGDIVLHFNCDGIFRDNKNLTKFYKGDYSQVQIMTEMYYGCNSIVDDFDGDTSNVVQMQSAFANTGLHKVLRLDTSNASVLQSIFSGCRYLVELPVIDLSSASNCASMFRSNHRLKEIIVENMTKATDISYFATDCFNVKTIKTLDMRAITNSSKASTPFGTCKVLENLTINNINVSLQIGSGTSYGHLLTLDSLLNTIKELWDNTSGTSTKTLTVSTPSKALLKNTYVKLIDITDEMRAEDEYIDNKKPFVVCESTDEGAMTAEEYVISKNWQLA